MLSYKSVLVLLAFLFGLVGANIWLAPGQVAQMKIDADDGPTRGYAVNCGKVPFNISWTPKDVKPVLGVNVTVVYKVPYTFNGGFVNASLYFHGSEQPFIGYADNVSCADIKKYVPCPILKGLMFHQTIPIDARKAASFPGKYDAVASVKNQDGKEMICANITVRIL